MMFILFDAQDVKKTQIRKIELDNNYYINEVVFSNNILDTINSQPKRFLDKLRYKFYDRKFEKNILKALDKHDTKWYYILSKDLQQDNKYLVNKFEQLLGYKVSNVNEMDTNIFKYIAEYANESGKLKTHTLKVLLVVTNSKNLNLTLLSNLIKECKSVNIYLKDNPSEYILNRIKQINKTEGCTIEILKRERKSFTEYNVIYFVDDFKENYPRFRLNKNSEVIDLQTTKSDKYNSDIIYLTEYLNKQGVKKHNIEDLKSKYNYIELASAVKKITNILDKC